MKKMIKITYAVTVCNEEEEFRDLMDCLLENINPTESEILIQIDSSNTTDEIRKYADLYLNSFGMDDSYTITVTEFPLNKNFANFKNNLFAHAHGEWIFQLDADELPPEKVLQNIDEVINNADNENIDCIIFPRINIVEGITEYLVNKWKWNLGKLQLDEMVVEKEASDIPPEYYQTLEKFNFIIETNGNVVKYYQPVINFPDYQMRMYRNNGKLKWVGKVHEKIEAIDGSKVEAGALSQQIEVCITHNKNIDRQIKQNDFYKQLLGNG